MAALLIRIKCWLKGHELVLRKPLLIGGHLYWCGRCQVELCIHHGRQQVIPYDEDVKRCEAQLERVYAELS